MKEREKKIIEQHNKLFCIFVEFLRERTKKEQHYDIAKNLLQISFLCPLQKSSIWILCVMWYDITLESTKLAHPLRWLYLYSNWPSTLDHPTLKSRSHFSNKVSLFRWLKKKGKQNFHLIAYNTTVGNTLWLFELRANFFFSLTQKKWKILQMKTRRICIIELL